jgi:hypothetical protein
VGVTGVWWGEYSQFYSLHPLLYNSFTNSSSV